MWTKSGVVMYGLTYRKKNKTIHKNFRRNFLSFFLPYVRVPNSIEMYCRFLDFNDYSCEIQWTKKEEAIETNITKFMV